MTFFPIKGSLFLLTILMLSCMKISSNTGPEDHSNEYSEERMTLVLAVPSVLDTYYRNDHSDIVEFMINYANTILGHDNVILIADRHTMPLLSGQLPDDVLLTDKIEDIWMRDFTTVGPERSVHFSYRPSYFENLGDAIFIQNKFRRFMDDRGLYYTSSELILDGGNVVDNHKDAVIVSQRFLEDNDLGTEEAKEQLRTLLDVDYVAIIPYDDDIMGHADGMAMWTGSRELLINEYEEPFRSQVLSSLRLQLPQSLNITEVDVIFDDQIWQGFASACGIHLNSVLTKQHIYVPVFQNELDTVNLQLIASITDKEVHSVNASSVCHMGGNVRCLTWQLQGANAERLINAARTD